MSKSLEARLMRLESETNQASSKIVVVGDENELEQRRRAGDIAADTIVVFTGVPRALATFKARAATGQEARR